MKSDTDVAQNWPTTQDNEERRTAVNGHIGSKCWEPLLRQGGSGTTPNIFDGLDVSTGESPAQVRTQ